MDLTIRITDHGRSTETPDICLEDFRDLDSASESLRVMTVSLNEAINAVLPGCGLELQWMNIRDKMKNPRGAYGFFAIRAPK